MLIRHFEAALNCKYDAVSLFATLIDVVVLNCLFASVSIFLNDLLQRRCNQFSFVKDEALAKTTQMPQETITSIMGCLQACARYVKLIGGTENSEAKLSTFSILSRRERTAFALFLFTKFRLIEQVHYRAGFMLQQCGSRKRGRYNIVDGES